MFTYHFREWLIFFYFYCIVGWCFESAYVSIRQHRLLNRGFLQGPWLPIYGSGAITVLWLTLPFREYPWAVYVIGMLGATVLEFCTGEAMVRLFRMRYWDYSDQKFQFRGHICLSSSVVWGFFSLLMVYVIHEPVADFVLGLNGEFLSVSSHAITAAFVCDFTMAFRRAMDLRELLEQAEQLRAQIEERAVEKKRVMEAAAVFTRDALQKEMDEKRRAAAAARAALVRDVEEKGRAAAEAAANTRDTLLEQADERFTAIRESGEYLQERLRQKRLRRARVMKRIRENRRLTKRLEHITRRAAQNSAHVLKRNPTARFMIESELAESIRDQLKKLRDRE